MTKKVAVLAVNPVNGFGLFQYLETFFEKGISYKVYAVADSTTISTNSGIGLKVDDVIANLKGRAKEFDALVFACGDAIPVFQNNAEKSFNIDLLTVIREFADENKWMIGHCAAGLIFEIAGVTDGCRLAIHPLAKPAIQKGIATDDAVVVDGNFFTAQCEHTISELMPQVLRILED